jgi:hypothetical protein
VIVLFRNYSGLINSCATSYAAGLLIIGFSQLGLSMPNSVVLLRIYITQTATIIWQIGNLYSVVRNSQRTVLRAQSANFSSVQFQCLIVYELKSI